MSRRSTPDSLLEKVDSALEASSEALRDVERLVPPALLQEARDGLAAWLSK